jgi:ATP-dependent helicase/nuclease subunit B
MVLLAPKQGTYQLEQQLLSGSELAGYTRLFILSFESLAQFVLQRLGTPFGPLLSNEGRVMVLRSLLSKQRDGLKVFRASARLTGFAQELSKVLSDLQQANVDPATLNGIAGGLEKSQGLKGKLEDLAVMLQAYQDWLAAHTLHDAEALLKRAFAGLHDAEDSALRLQSVWVDGFAEFSDTELDLLAALLPRCEQLTITFCLSGSPVGPASWLSHWDLIERTLRKCRSRFAPFIGENLKVDVLPSGPADHRFASSPALRHLQQCWEAPRPFKLIEQPSAQPEVLIGTDPRIAQPEPEPELDRNASLPLRLVQCAHPEGEVIAAAREILKFVRAGGRYRDAAVLVRSLDRYHHLFQRVFGKYDIPFFLDRRESVSHHPMAELTRSALRLVAFDWKQEDWFAALKTGLVPVPEQEIDLLENEALARGWKGQTWLRPLEFKEPPRNANDAERLERLALRLEDVRRQLVPPFERFALDLASTRNRPTGPQLADAVQALWDSLDIQDRLTQWSANTSETQGTAGSPSVHETVWRQMVAWLENAALAFVNDSLPLREWIPILDAGLASLSVGIIPPSLDQVLIGAVDRSRTPDVKLGLVLGLNEGVFPGKPESSRLLSDEDRVELERHQISLGPTLRNQLGRERYLGYIACTRARERLVLTWAASDPDGAPLNPSALVSHVKKLFPTLTPEVSTVLMDWQEAQHASELVESVLRSGAVAVPFSAGNLGRWQACLENLNEVAPDDALQPELASRLYGSVLRTSVSRMEHFAACPFKFFAHSGLRAEERKLFELDSREQGTFQHDVLALFHQTLQSEGKRWRDLSPSEARDLVGKIARSLLTEFRQGLLQASDQARFTARVLTESLQDFVDVLVSWMREQYLFDPIEVELPFGVEQGAPAWTLNLPGGNRLELYGRIDRVDLYRDPVSRRALCVVIDYKSSRKQLEPLLMQNGLQLQLLTYLNVLRQWPDSRSKFGVDEFDPAGVFYVSLRGQYPRERTRTEALAEPQRARRLAYRHSGRFDLSALPFLDSRKDPASNEQFNYRFRKDGQLHASCREALDPDAFQAMLGESEQILTEMGQRIYSGVIEVSPYRKGQETACGQCTYHAVCRIDPTTHRFRGLTLRGDRDPESDADTDESAEA